VIEDAVRPADVAVEDVESKDGVIRFSFPPAIFKGKTAVLGDAGR